MTKLPWCRRWIRETKTTRPERIRLSRAERRRARMRMRLSLAGGGL
jgi:hypothetical protein